MKWLVVSALLLAACSKPLPPLAANLPSDVRAAETVFDARVKAEFKIGTLDSDVRRALGRQNFDKPAFVRDVPAGWWASDFDRGDAMCNTVWSIRWRTSAADRITEIWGVYGLQCREDGHLW